MKQVQEYAQALVGAWEAVSPKEQSRVTDRFVQLLLEDRMQHLVPQIVKAVEREVSAREARRRVTAEIARAETADTIKQLKAETKISDDIVGGFRLRREYEIIDASVGGALESMRRTLAT